MWYIFQGIGIHLALVNLPAPNPKRIESRCRTSPSFVAAVRGFRVVRVFRVFRVQVQGFGGGQVVLRFRPLRAWLGNTAAGLGFRV